MPRLLPLFALVLLCAACAAVPDRKRVTDAATSPLADLNLTRTEIPDLLLAAQAAPYALPPVTGCEALGEAIAALDEVLGPDLDAPRDEAERSMVERGSEAVGDAAVGALQGAAQGVLPFRGWLRKLSGADKHSREVSAAIAAGRARRAFIKGLRVGLAC
ncbi:MAG TPA: hypothetical protein VLI72_13035 [Methylibium sp.]|nr:hypothetical protein [Methylibium sp.]